MSRLSRALEEGQVTNNGPYVLDFEAVLSKYLRVPTICFSSGQAALTALLMDMDVRDKVVIYPAFTFPATPSAIVAAGGQPVAADIDPKTLTIDPDSIESIVCNPNVQAIAAILAVDVYGISSVSEKLIERSYRWDIPVIVDAAPSFGTHVMTKPNAFLAPSIYSFHATKQMAVGEGGCLSSKNKDLINRCKRIRNFGLDGEKWVEPGINGKMTEISALIGLENMKTFRERMLKRRQIKLKLDDYLSRVNHVYQVLEPRGQTVSWLYCPVLIGKGSRISRDEVMKQLAERGIQTRRYYGWYVSHYASTPVAFDVASRVIALPCHEYLTDDDIEHIRTSFMQIMGPRA